MVGEYHELPKNQSLKTKYRTKLFKTAHILNLHNANQSCLYMNFQRIENGE